MTYKKRLQIVCIVFVGILMAFTFFSQTLADLRIARVSLAFSEARTVVPEVHSAGTVVHADTQLILAPVGGTIVHMADEGYRGLSASVFFTIHSDVQDLQDRLLAAQDEQRLVNLNIERVRNDRASELQRITQINAGAPIGPGLAEYDLQLVSNSHQMELAQRDLETQQSLFDQGLVPQQTVNDRENAIAALELAREQILSRRALAEERQAEFTADQDRTRAAQVAQHQSAIAQLDVQMQIHAMESNRIASRITELTEQIEEGGIVEVQAGSNLTILEYMPGVTVGARINEGMPIMLAAVRNNRFRVEVAFGQNIGFLEEGRPAVVALHRDLTEQEVLFGGGPASELTGRILRTFPRGDRMMVVVDVESGQLYGGERAEIRVQGPGIHTPQVVPRSALRRDAGGYYLLYVEARERLFGFSYYARVQRGFTVGAHGTDGYVATVLNWGIDPIEAPVIINSDVPVYAGDRVRPVGAGDFIGTR